MWSGLKAIAIYIYIIHTNARWVGWYCLKQGMILLCQLCLSQIIGYFCIKYFMNFLGGDSGYHRGLRHEMSSCKYRVALSKLPCNIGMFTWLCIDTMLLVTGGIQSSASCRHLRSICLELMKATQLQALVLRFFGY